MDKLLFKRILIGGLTLLAVIYVVYLLLNINFGVYPTENAVEVSVTDKIYANAMIIRDETYIKNSSSGVVSYTVEDGDEVHSGGVVAKIYSSEEDAAARTKADALEGKMNSLKELEKTKKSDTVGIDTINNEIKSNILTYIKNINNADIHLLDDDINKTVDSINHYKIYTGKNTNFQSEISDLRNQISQLRSNSKDSISDISTTKAGYFSTKCDGYENCYKYSDISKITLNDFRNLNKKDIPSNVIGKTMSSLNWYITCEITTDEATNLSLWSRDVTVKFSDAFSEPVLASIYKIEQEKDSDKALLILECNYMSKELSEARQDPVEIGMGTYTGLRVSKKAIHDDNVEKVTYDDNHNKKVETKKVQGVYVLYGSEVQFKEISIIYSGKDYVLCDPTPEDGVLFSDDTVSLYDQVILEGDDLYDGKVIK
ncbi:MAG: HlyD family efflux transporter periplasmic adaptor subunit [Ruminococcus sp.]|nr:HlyD family efflux transporter periplasmic adaptor subunit [Ruminococcus sp.]